MNLYPVKTDVDGQTVRNLRLVAEDGHTQLWRWDRDADKAILFRSASGAPERVGASQSWRVAELVIEPQRGCGCQHPMYAFVPPRPRST